MNIYKCIVVDDEPLAQNVLKKYIDEHPALEITAVCSDAMQAQAALIHNPVHIIFLDINLPKLSGITFFKTLANPPLVILTTAYPEFAVEGFELDALDYLLKPFSFERFLKAVNKALEKLNRADNVASEQKIAPFIFLKSEKKVYKVDLEDIIYLEAIGDYVKVVCKQGQHIVNDTMKNLLEILPATQFIRVHKSYIISKNKINFFEGNYVKLGEKDIPIGGYYKEEIFTKLKEKNL